MRDWPLRSVKVQSVKVQTNILELLGLDDLDDRESQYVAQYSEGSERFIDDVIDERNTALNLVRGVIDRLDSSEFASQVSEKDNKIPSARPFNLGKDADQEKPKPKKTEP